MNKVCLIGRLTKDSDVRYTQSNNTMVVNFNLAVNRRFASENGERDTDFITIVAWSKTAEFVNKYFKKGQQVGIVGRIQTRNWDDDQGIKHYATEVVAEEVYFADSKKDGNDVFNEYGDMFAGNSNNDSPDFEVASGDDLPF
ncbi:MAG: single-stranded DNA-binding protein [Clostridia bacterium]|nr:single-stranded DNA-binding protein [Clostridia bacterium]